MSDFAFRPEFLRGPDDAPASCATYDHIEAQLRDLIKTRHPGRKLTPGEMDELVKAHLNGRALGEYGVWVYYPWSRRIVHLLAEEEFVELRTNRNRYKITPAEQALLAAKRIGIVGLSVGQSVAVTLALERGFGELRLTDFDHLDLSNLNRLRAGVHNLGIPKVVVTAREIAEIDPFLKVECFPEGLRGDSYDPFLVEGGKLDHLIEECDSIDVKIRVRQEARRHQIPVLMDTSDRGLLDIERFDLEPERPIFHGLIGDPDPALLAGLTTEQKVPYVLKIIGEDSLSLRMRASMIEVEASIGTWPQLASSVTLGGALATDLARRMLLDQCRVSGRFYVDLNEIVPDVPAVPIAALFAPAPPRLTSEQMAAQAAQVDAPSAQVPMEDVRGIVADGITAPSGGNCQPWVWYWDGRLHLFHDRSRSHSLLDFRSFGAFAALGAAWENVVLSAKHRGWAMEERLLPGGDIAATFSFQRLAPGSAAILDTNSWVAAIPIDA